MSSIKMIRVLLLVSLAIYQITHAMETPPSSNTFTETLVAYNPINAFSRRTPFAYCILKATYNTATGHQAPVLQPENMQLNACTIGTVIRDVTQHKQTKPFLWGVATSAHQVDGGCSPDSCSWARWEIEQQDKKVQQKAGKACNHWN